MKTMKKYITIVLFSITSISTYGQIDALMKGYDNKYAFEHIEMYIKNPEENFTLSDLPSFNDSLRIINVDSNWLQSITTLIKQNPSIIYPYLDSSTQNLAAYILLVHTFNIQITDNKEQTYLYIIKNEAFDPVEIATYVANNTIPPGVDPSVHLINYAWGQVAGEANMRIKATDLKVKDQLLKTLTLTPKSTSLYQRDGYDNSDIFYPWNINEKITVLLDNFLNTDDYAFMANTTCAKYLADYKVKTESSHLVSLEKTVSGTSCSTPLVVDTDYFNFFETDYGVVYSVNIRRNSYIISEINKLASSKTSCNYNSSTTKAYLFFDANKPKLVVRNQSCSDTIDLDVNQLEFVFTNTSVNLIKNNTVILD